MSGIEDGAKIEDVEDIADAPPASETEPEDGAPPDAEDTGDEGAPATESERAGLIAARKAEADKRRAAETKAEELEQLLDDKDALHRYMALRGMMPEPPAQRMPPTDPREVAFREEYEWTPDDGFIDEAAEKAYKNSVVAKYRAEDAAAKQSETALQQAVNAYNSALDVISAREGIEITAKEKQDSLQTAIAIAKENRNLSEAQIAEQTFGMIAYSKLKGAKSKSEQDRAATEAEVRRAEEMRRKKEGLAGAQVTPTGGAVTTEPEQYDSVAEAARKASEAFYKQ